MPDVYFNKNRNSKQNSQRNSSASGQSSAGRKSSARRAYDYEQDDSYYENRQSRQYQNQYYDEQYYDDAYYDDSYYDESYPDYTDYGQVQQRRRNRSSQAQSNRNAAVKRNKASQRNASQRNRHAAQQYRYPDEPSETRKAKKTRRKRRGCLRHSLISYILIFAILYTGIAFAIFGKANVDHTLRLPDSSSLSLTRSPFVYNILLVGDDSREDAEMERADTMIIVSIDNLHRKIKLTSLLRDSYVSIPGYGMNKLNAATAYGGVDLLMDTIEENYNIHINKYVMVNFSAFTNLIDAVGGVDVAVTQKEANYLNSTWYKWTLTGNQVTFDYGDSVHLDGEKALMFVRIRKLDSDVQRTRRQRLVIAALKEKLMEASVTDLMSLPSDVMSNITTDMGRVKMLNFSIKALLLYRNYEIVQTSLPMTGTWEDKVINGSEVVYFDIDEAAEDLKQFIYKDVYSEA